MNRKKYVKKNKKSFKSILFLSFLLFAIFSPSYTLAEDSVEPHCSQYCVDIVCKLYGVPVSLDKIMEILPPQKGGQSLLAIKNALEHIGFEVEARQINFEELAAGPFPLIVHMKSHFAVVEGVNQELISIFDNQGRRDIRISNFTKQWEGYVLYINLADSYLPKYIGVPSKNEPRIKFDKLFYDIGDVSYYSKYVDFEFDFKNIGKAPLSINKITTSCKCAVPNSPKQSILPGKEGIITVRYKTTKKKGSFNQFAYVQTNDPKFPIIKLNITGYLEDKVLVNPPELNFGKVMYGETAKATCFIRYRGSHVLELKPPISDMSGLQYLIQKITRQNGKELINKKYELSKLNNYKNKYIVRIFIDTENLTIGENFGHVVFNTSLPGFSDLHVPLEITVLPPVKASKTNIFLGEIKNNEKICEEIELISTNGTDFQVESVEIKDTSLSCEYETGYHTKNTLKFFGEGTTIDDIINVVITNGKSKPFELKIPVYGYLSQSNN